MSKNLFESAINKNETNDFFRGNGKYFVPSPDYDGHVHGANIGGYARVFAENNKKSMMEFEHAFILFLQSLEVSKEDLAHLLANLSAFFAQRSRNGFSASCLFKKKEAIEYQVLLSYIKKIRCSSFFEDIKDQLQRHANFIEKKGECVLSDIIQIVENEAKM